jgi:hypothetical protein
MRYKFIHLGEAYFVENHQGTVHTLYRFFRLPASAAVKQFGNALPEHILNAARSATMSETQFEFLHCVYPRVDYDPRRVDSGGMKYASIYLSIEHKKFLREKGYTSFPFAVSRYVQAPGEIYGRGPAMMVLPGIKVLNEEKKAVIKQGHRALDPVILAYDDGVVGTFSLRNGAVNSGAVNADGKPLVHVLPSGNLAVGDKMMEMERAAINDAFLITLFQILTENPQMTATEVLERTREKGMLIAPTAGRQHSELLGPMIERELDILAFQGKLPEMPPLLQQAGGAYAIEYDSPMARMQRAENAAGFTRSLSFAQEYAKMTGDMSPLDYFAMDRAMPAILDINGSPVEWTSSDEEVKAKRDDRAQAQQQAALMQNSGGLASAAKSLADLPGKVAA